MRDRIALVTVSMLLWTGCTQSTAQAPAQGGLDQQVTAFLQQHRFGWHDMNVPASDGRALHDLVLSKRFTRALEIGTSTGHSAIWMAWALSKTGGKLVTIDIDEGRYREALNNFRQAGVSAYVDARLADAHELVPRLEGPFDLVFIDADKDWYTNYARAVLPKLTDGGCLTAHNVSPGPGHQFTGGFYEFITAVPEMDTTFNAGVLVSCRRASRRD